MQFDDFDRKIKEAAEHHHPAYEEKAWDKMEKMLDKHLPVEKDNRRRFVFLLLFLLLGGLGVYLGISKPWQPTKKSVATAIAAPVNEKNNASSTENLSNEKKTGASTEPATTPEFKAGDAVDKVALPDKKGDVQNADEATTATQVAGAPVKTKSAMLPVRAGNVKQNTVLGTNPNTVTTGLTGTKGKRKVNLQQQDINDDLKATTTTRGLKNIPVRTKSDKTEVSTGLEINSPNSIEAAGIDKAKQDAIATTTAPPATTVDSVAKPNQDALVKADSVKKKEETVQQQKPAPAKRRKSYFAINFSIGPDLSTVGIKDIGKVRPVYGAGLSYTFNRFTIRSGFYVADKVYTAGPDDYHPPKHYWTNYVDLDKVEADCKLYEIPVTVAYTFSESKTHNWFGAAGLSTFLMKNENYGYYYKDRTSAQPTYTDWTLKNGENHIFSILNLSGGYERKINKTFSIIAEPYLKIPMDGIGFGSIKLNSAGVLFTLSVKPFASHK